MGIFKEMANRIRERKDRGEVVVFKSDITDGIDVSELPRKDLERRYIMAAASCAFNACGYRSLRYGSEAFIDVDNTDNTLALYRLSRNANVNVEKRAMIASSLVNRYRESVDAHPEFRQMYFDESGRVLSEPTDAEIIEMLLSEREAI